WVEKLARRLHAANARLRRSCLPGRRHRRLGAAAGAANTALLRFATHRASDILHYNTLPRTTRIRTTHMTNRKLSLIIGALLGSTFAAVPAMAADLLDVYRLAQQNDPEIAIAEGNFRAAAEASPQARAAYLPQISINGSYTLLNETDSTSDEVNFQDDGSVQVIPGIDSMRDSDGWNASLNLRQTIFNWSRVKEISRASADVARAEAEFTAAQQNLIVRVAERYFNLLAAQDSLEAARINREAIGQQLDQTRRRFDVGLIAITDVQESQAAFDQATAAMIAAERTLNTARENLRAIIGEYVDQVARPQADMPLASPQPAPAHEWLQRAP